MCVEYNFNVYTSANVSVFHFWFTSWAIEILHLRLNYPEQFMVLHTSYFASYTMVRVKSQSSTKKQKKNKHLCVLWEKSWMCCFLFCLFGTKTFHSSSSFFFNFYDMNLCDWWNDDDEKQNRIEWFLMQLNCCECTSYCYYLR